MKRIILLLPYITFFNAFLYVNSYAQMNAPFNIVLKGNVLKTNYELVDMKFTPNLHTILKSEYSKSMVDTCSFKNRTYTIYSKRDSIVNFNENDQTIDVTWKITNVYIAHNTDGFVNIDIIKDNPTDSVNIIVYNYQEDIENINSVLFTRTDSKPYTKDISELKKIYNNYNFNKHIQKIRLYVGVSANLGFANNLVLANTPQFQQYDALNTRRVYETKMPTTNFSLQAGIQMRRGHVIFGEVGLMKLGFKINGYTIDWNTGLLNDDTSKYEYKFNNWVLGMGYSYRSNNVNNTVGFVSELAFYCTIGKEFQSVESKKINQDRFGARLGMGLCIKPSIRWEIKVMPTLIWDFSSLHDQIIRTKLMHYGMTVGVGSVLW